MLRLYTDGSYSDLTGIGSWAWLLVGANGHEVGSGAVGAGATHQRMELTAAVEGLAAVPEGSAVVVISDSSYVVEPMSRRYPERWRERGWSSLGHSRQIVHRDLWERLVELAGRRRVRFAWVRAHSGAAGDPWNEMADHLAKTARRLGEAEEVEPGPLCHAG